MKASQLWGQYQHHTRDVTEQGRKLGFAGAAILQFPELKTFLPIWPGRFVDALDSNSVNPGI
jgi:hypothetical protein